MTYRIKAERLAYWYFRLNGFLLIENFILHDEVGRQQRTEADLIAVRFPHRKEALRKYDNHEEWMEDDQLFAGKTTPFGAFVEVTTGPCKINGTWTDRSKGNLPRALRAFGQIPECEIDSVSKKLYQTGRHQSDFAELGLISIGRERDSDLTQNMPDALQIVWNDVKGFIFDRFTKYKRIKQEHSQWADDGHLLWNAFKKHRTSKRDFSESIEGV